ncbi:PE-PGRS family protein [Streptomyces griseoruber]|uniref:PE-PGRS family protein n=1 Tax=Streptomyces griseoruber TaxID=1943 RepID=UPI0037B69727
MTVDGMSARLERAGLEIADPWYSEGPLPPREAWRRVTSGETAPLVTLPGDRLAEVDARWHRLAAENGFFEGDGLFLVEIDGPRPGSGPRHWARVRLTPGWDLTGGLRPAPDGQAEFVAMAVGGDTLLGVTADADGVRITVVDRIAERVEAEALRAAEETPRQREEAWESLLAGASRKFWLLWAESLGGNPGVPDDLRIELLGLSGALPYYRQSAAVVEAAMAHEDPSVRARFAEYQRNLTAEQLGRLIVAETEARYRAYLIWTARHRGLPSAVCEQLVTDPSFAVREELAQLPGLPVPVLAALSADSHACVRAAACGPAWPHLDERTREGLLHDDDGSVRTAALLRHHEDHPVPRSVFEAAEPGVQARMVEGCRLARDLAERVTRDEDPARRRSLARNPFLETDLVLLLGEDHDGDVRFQASVHPRLSEEERARIDFPFEPRSMSRDLDWVAALHGDPDAMRRLAASAHPVVRRGVARARHLPPDVVERLARDEDRIVHLFLAESCEDAPAELLLSVWRWWTGSFSHPNRPHSHPNFPRRDLLRYADDPSPRMRRLALDDPDSTPELVERFGRDVSDEVRARAADDPRLSAASAVRLLSDPYDTVRAAAARHPELPARTLVGLLRDLATAETAARHPGLPVPVMRRILEEARAALA